MKYLLPFVLLWFVSSCRQPEDPPTFSSLIVTNQWKVGYCRDGGNIITGLYNGWRFSFSADGSCIVTTGSGTVNGTWEENNAARKVKILLNSSSTPASYMSREWELIFMNPSRIKLGNDRFAPFQELYFDKL